MSEIFGNPADSIGQYRFSTGHFSGARHEGEGCHSTTAVTGADSWLQAFCISLRKVETRRQWAAALIMTPETPHQSRNAVTDERASGLFNLELPSIMADNSTSMIFQND